MTSQPYSQRYLEASILGDLTDKMVFVAGPRQVGKTTLARRMLDASGGGVDLSWDSHEDRREIRAARWPGAGGLVVLDELHKRRGWKGWLKGEFDKHRDRIRFLVTGSARLDVYRRGGDSLQGRYHHHRLHPFSQAELAHGGAKPQLPEPGTELEIPASSDQKGLELLLAQSGFPEPLLAGSVRAWRRWQKERLDRFFREDVRELEAVRELASMQLLAEMLPERVGSPLSVNAMREELEVSHRSVSHWLDVLERLYHLVRIRPFTHRRIRALRKMPKAYLWDWSLVEGRGARFENLVAMHLLKFCHHLEDREGITAELWYLRDRTGREVDFLVTSARKPWFAVEAKLADTHIDPSLFYFRERLGIPWCYQVLLEGERDFVQDGVRCLPARRFLAALV